MSANISAGLPDNTLQWSGGGRRETNISAVDCRKWVREHVAHSEAIRTCSAIMSQSQRPAVGWNMVQQPSFPLTGLQAVMLTEQQEKALGRDTGRCHRLTGNMVDRQGGGEHKDVSKADTLTNTHLLVSVGAAASCL